MIKIEINLGGIDEPEKIHSCLAKAMDFPSYYGRNLDALYDCLTEICDDTCVCVYGLDKDSKGDYAARLRRVFRDAEDDNPHLCIFFAN